MQQANNDKTGSIFISKDKFSASANQVGIKQEDADNLWNALVESSSQRIIAGATAPRQDAANVNAWHWSETDLEPWAKQRMAQLFEGIQAEGVPDKGFVRITKLKSCSGEASVSNRKGKRIVAFELKVTFEWKGSVDYDDVEGELIFPYISEDVSDADYEIKWTAKEKDDASHKSALRYLQKKLPQIKQGLKSFDSEIRAK